MLSVYRRHRSKCKFADDRISRKCRCSLWATGTLEGKPYRKSLKTRSFEKAQQIVREIEDGKDTQGQPKSITVETACAAFIRDREKQNLGPSTIKKYKLMAARLQEFATRKNICDLQQFSKAHALDFRATWQGSPRTLQKALERLRSIFRFFVMEAGFIGKNPAEGIKAPKVKILPRLPFSEKEVADIIAQAKDDRELAFVLTLRHTGLRIGDAALLETRQFSEGRIHLYTTKGGVPVSILLPDNLVSLLKKLPPHGGYFFVRGDSTAMHTCADLWRRRIKILCEAAGVSPDHPHRFRHSLAADLLMKGASVEDVAAILGNSPAIVIKHYSQWIRGRQERLDDFIEKTWEPKLVRVK